MDPRKLQAQMMEALQQAQQLQEEAAATEVEESAGGGMVTVKANGAGEVVAITIAKEAIDPDDPETLEDLVVAAVNNALEAAQALAESRMGASMPDLGGLGLPGFGA